MLSRIQDIRRPTLLSGAPFLRIDLMFFFLVLHKDHSTSICLGVTIVPPENSEHIPLLCVETIRGSLLFVFPTRTVSQPASWFGHSPLIQGSTFVSFAPSRTEQKRSPPDSCQPDQNHSPPLCRVRCRICHRFVLPPSRGSRRLQTRRKIGR